MKPDAIPDLVDMVEDTKPLQHAIAQCAFVPTSKIQMLYLRVGVAETFFNLAPDAAFYSLSRPKMGEAARDSWVCDLVEAIAARGHITIPPHLKKSITELRAPA